MAIKLSRKELYERVWAEPMQKLAKEYGLSDVGLAKICQRFVIPVPPRGYWARKHAGKRVTQPALPPEGRKGYGDSIHFHSPEDRPVKVVPPSTPLHPLIAAESDPDNAISVPEDLLIRHPLLRSTQQYWRFVKRPDFRWDAPAPAHVSMDVDPATRPRALRVLQALFAALGQRGHEVVTGERGQVQLKVLDETCGLALRERQRQVRLAPPKKASASIFDRPRPFDLVHTGELELRLEKRFGREVIRDSKSGRLEAQLNGVIVQLLNIAFEEKEYRANQERKRLEEVERERQRSIAQQRAREERARVQRLERLMAGADHHKQLVTFAAELRTAVGQVEPASELGRWLEWLDAYIKDADVLGRFRSRQPKLTLYYCASTYEADGIVRNGFRDESAHYGDDAELPASVSLADVPMERQYGGSVCVTVEVPEDAALPYESAHDGGDYRRFNLPASIVNHFPRRLYGR